MLDVHRHPCHFEKLGYSVSENVVPARNCSRSRARDGMQATGVGLRAAVRTYILSGAKMDAVRFDEDNMRWEM